ncbi:MAG: hypothetical protein IKL95_01135 [Alphaproteobacteria bacterium]|nr:hypothetical protein [Alphaproteobacteria bacterium]
MIDNILSEHQEVSNFINLYMQYNKKYNKLYPNLVNSRGGALEEQQALKLKDNLMAQQEYNKLKDKILNDFVNIPSNHCGAGKRDRLWQDSRFQREILYNKENNSLEDFLRIIFQLRCNVIHASKDFDNIDIELIRWANTYFGTLLKNINYFQYVTE